MKTEHLQVLGNEQSEAEAPMETEHLEVLENEQSKIEAPMETELLGLEDEQNYHQQVQNNLEHEQTDAANG